MPESKASVSLTITVILNQDREVHPLADVTGTPPSGCEGKSGKAVNNGSSEENWEVTASGIKAFVGIGTTEIS
ncbi:MAG: hypothetical protein V3U49_03175 [Nitrososphaerales archaeon]